MASFADLPFEIRDQIWALTLKPRIVRVSVRAYSLCEETVLYLASSTPIPTIMQLCRESRLRGSRFYEKFSLSKNTEHIYVFVNLEADIIDIGDTWSYELFEECGRRIRRLKFEADNFSEAWYYDIARDLKVFSGLIQCFVLATNGWEAWEDAFEEHGFACAAEGLFIIDKDRSRVLSFPELEGLTTKDGWRQIVENLGVPYDEAAVVLDTKAVG